MLTLSAYSPGQEAFPRVSDEGAALAKQARLTLRLRSALQLCEWGDAGSWAGLVDVLEAAAATVSSALDAVPSDPLMQGEPYSPALLDAIGIEEKTPTGK